MPYINQRPRGEEGRKGVKVSLFFSYNNSDRKLEDDVHRAQDRINVSDIINSSSVIVAMKLIQN